MRQLLSGNPLLNQGFQNDPRNAMGQMLMQQGSSTAPVQSWGEALARALQAPVGGYFQSQARGDFEKQDEKYRKGLATALQGGDVVNTLSRSEDPYLQSMGLEARLKQQMDPQQDPLVKVFDQASGTEKWVKQSQATGLQASGPEAPKTRQVGDPKRPGVLIDQQYNSQTGAWDTVGERLPEPKQAQETWRVVNGPDGKPAYLESSLGNQKALPGQESGGAFKQANTLRDEYNTLTKDFRTVQDAYNKITSTSDTGAGDMSLLYSYVKLLDPGSVVRESEFATAAASGSYGERIQGLVQRVLTGERLPATLRQEFKTEAQSIYQGQKMAYDNAGKQYTDLATRHGINPSDVVVPYATAPVDPGPTSAGGPSQRRAPKVLTYNPETGMME